MKIQITLKSGAQITADVDSFTSKRNAVGGLAGVEWHDYEKGTTDNLNYVDVDEITAIVALGVKWVSR